MVAQILTSLELDQILASRPPLAGVSDRGLGSPFLRLLATAGREQLAQLLTEEHYVPGQIIFREDDLGDTMYIIRSGRAAVVKGDFQAPTVLGYRGVGEIIGEMALLENRPRSASVIAVEDLHALSIKRNDFEGMLSQNPTMGLSILGTLSARLRAADDARKASSRTETRLVRKVSLLQTEKQSLLELEQLRQDTVDLIVHDLRHPISSLFGAIKILEMVLPEDVLETNQQLLNIANSNCDHLQLMVDSLLDVARMESDEDNLNLGVTNLRHLVRENISRTKILTDMEKIAVRTTIAPDLPTIVADEEMISRVLGNLLNNAIKYTSSGGEVSILAELQDDHVQVSVSDTGPGIPPEDRERVFERFAQLAGDQGRSGGYGLGLAYCRLAVKAHGGNIWVESGDNGVGCRFVFTLPLIAYSPAADNLSSGIDPRPVISSGEATTNP